MTHTSSSATAPDVGSLYHVGGRWIHRLHPLTKLAAVVPITVLGFALPVQGTAVLLAVLVLGLLAGGQARPLLRPLVLLLPIGLALLVVHGIVSPTRGEALLSLGPVELGAGGALSAASVLARLAVFVLTITVVMDTTHPKVLATALIERGVSHKVAYAYLAGVELLPEMRGRARDILDAQQSRGFDTRGGPVKRARGLIVLLKPLLLGAMISAETRALALDSRGFGVKGTRTSTARVPRTAGAPMVQWILLGLAVCVVVGGIVL
ncbi:energy-coupling factor transporter transmembrane component T family protein [Nonomuraea sp. NPDC050790]|uniref:energy-coupling factor transporter transmembrane component T family protein n=1 Tax=Nonomuraea sp. NPDC050790 TaxID=3364371 RepID=UPI00378ED7CD